MAKRRTNLEWQSLFEQYESSSVTQRAFCEEHGLSLSTFFAKRRQLQTASQSESVGFVKAEIVEKTTKYQAQIAILLNSLERCHERYAQRSRHLPLS
ncbi:IS66 family insertion sequence element accessory protein TnpB [Vibrio breoganii]|uniref:IS66 family insertion sequence element accessory protein TnpA n=1 Tax=Vibrio breoganii TaxID=553239 RepID=UPI0009EE2609|nr:hypothetical protein [Vibrio breoganii]